MHLKSKNLKYLEPKIAAWDFRVEIFSILDCKFHGKIPKNDQPCKASFFQKSWSIGDHRRLLHLKIRCETLSHRLWDDSSQCPNCPYNGDLFVWGKHRSTGILPRQKGFMFGNRLGSRFCFQKTKLLHFTLSNQQFRGQSWCFTMVNSQSANPFL